MEIIGQFGIILGFCIVGDILSMIIPFPIPGSVWGMSLLFVAILTGKIHTEKVEKVADFLLSIMTIMFVPVGAGLIKSFDAIKGEMIPIVIIIIVTTVVTFVVTGVVAQKIIKSEGSWNDENI